jgi:hypothetical protein
VFQNREICDLIIFRKDLLCSDVEIPPFEKGPGPAIPQHLKMEVDLPPEFSKYPFPI